MEIMIRRFIGLMIFISLLSPLAFSQQGKVGEAIRKKEKVERSYEKAYEKARRKTIKHRKAIQTRETRQSMKEAERRANPPDSNAQRTAADPSRRTR